MRRILFLALLVARAGELEAQTDAGLRELRAVEIDVAKCPLASPAFRSRVERRLRTDGVPVVAALSDSATHGSLVVGCSVSTAGSSTIVTLSLQLWRAGRLVGVTTSASLGAWGPRISTLVIPAHVSGPASVYDQLERDLGVFAAAYQIELQRRRGR